MATKKNNYIDAELDWAEAQLATWKAYIDANPMEELDDIPLGKSSYRTVEVQGKFLQDTMKNYLSLLEVVKDLRKKDDEAKKKVRGDQELTLFESGDI